MMAYTQDFSRCPSALSSNSSSGVQPMSPEDVYDDRRHISASTHPLHSLPENSAQTYHTYQQQAPAHHHKEPAYSHSYAHSYVSSNPSTRQASNTSNTSSAATGTTATSASENWETYDDASEPEPDASDAYYAKLKAAAAATSAPAVYGAGAVGGKRYVPEAGHFGTVGLSQGKTFRGLMPGVVGMGTGGGGGMMRGQQQRHAAIEGSDAGWTDEDAF